MPKPDLKQFYIPTVIDHKGERERVYDIYSRLLEDRIIFVGDTIEDRSANIIIAQLLFLEDQDSSKDITLYINSPGGVVSAGLAIFDTMNYINPDVKTICVGCAASMGAFLLANGAPGKRFMLPHAKVLLHQPWARGVGGQITDIEITARELSKNKKLLTKLLAKNTGQDIEKLSTQLERDYWLDAEEALDYGVVDRIVDLNPRQAAEKKKKN